MLTHEPAKAAAGDAVAAHEPVTGDAGAGTDRATTSSSFALLLCAGAIWTLAILFTNILPTILELLRETLTLNENEMGSIGSSYVLGHGIVVALGPFWVRRVPVVAISVGALLAVAGALLFMALSPHLSSLISGWFLVGVATGMIGTPTFAILGDTPNPTRTFSLALFGATLVATLASFALPLISVLHAFVVGAMLFALAVPIAIGLRGNRIAAAPDPDASASAGSVSPGTLAAPLLAMVAGAILLGVSWGGVYNFVGVIGTANGMNVAGASWLVASGLIGALVGSIAPALIGGRFGSPIVMISFAILAILLTYPALVLGQPDLFVAALAAQGALTTAALAYLLGIVRELDTTGRAYIAFPAIQALGTAAATKFTGWFLTHWSAAAFIAAAGALILLSWIILLAAHRCRAVPDALMIDDIVTEPA